MDDTMYNPSIMEVEFDRSCIKDFVEEGRVGNNKRYWFFMHMKSKGLRVEEAIYLARENLYGPELEHAIQEGQIERIWRTGYQFPNPPVCMERLSTYCKKDECPIFKKWSKQEVSKYV